MNNEQLKHIAAMLHTLALAQFAVFGYAGITTQPVQWVQIALSIVGFFNLEFIAIWTLSFVRDKGKAS